jgi:hypothetical protein
MLTSNDTDLGKEYYTKVVDNFDIILVSIYTPSYDKWSRSYDLWKAEGDAEISSFQDRLTRMDIFCVESSSWQKPRKLETPKS